MVDRTIQTVKKTLRKAKLSNSDPYLTILALRTTPRQNVHHQYVHHQNVHHGKCSSPVQLSMNRNLLTTPPSPFKLVKQSYHRNAENLPRLNQGQSIRTHEDKSWSRKAIIKESEDPRRLYKLLIY